MSRPGTAIEVTRDELDQLRADDDETRKTPRRHWPSATPSWLHATANHLARSDHRLTVKAMLTMTGPPRL